MIADDDIAALQQLLPCGREHGVGFADTGRGAEENLQLASFGTRLLVPDLVKQAVRVGALVIHDNTLA